MKKSAKSSKNARNNRYSETQQIQSRKTIGAKPNSSPHNARPSIIGKKIDNNGILDLNNEPELIKRIFLI